MGYLLGRQMRKRDKLTGQFAKSDRAYWTPDNWDDGSIAESTGYFYVYRPDHPRALNGGWIKRCLANWWLVTGRIVKDGFVLHHKNLIRLDDSLSNLEEKVFGTHVHDHKVKPLIELICNGCGEEFLGRRKEVNRGGGKFCTMKCFWRCGNGNATNVSVIYADTFVDS